MLANNISDVEQHVFSGEELLLLDANIWLFVYGPLVSTSIANKCTIYSRIWRDICKVRATIYMTAIILSEFINRYARLEQRQTGNAHINFKTFRKSPAFAPIAAGISGWTGIRSVSIGMVAISALALLFTAYS